MIILSKHFREPCFWPPPFYTRFTFNWQGPNSHSLAEVIVDYFGDANVEDTEVEGTKNVTIVVNSKNNAQ